MKINKTNLFISNILSSKGTLGIFYILGIGLILRLSLSFFGTLQLDHGTFVAWSINLTQNGFSSFYNNWSDYLPGYLYVLWFLGKINLIDIFPTQFLYKLPAIFADLVTAYLIFKILKGKKGTVGALIYLINPAIFANSALWGQVDSFIALLSTLSIYLLPTHYILSAAALAVGATVKPQVAFIVPLIFLLMFRYKFNFKKVFVYGLVGFLTTLFIFLPFKNEPNLFSFVINRLTLSANQYPYTAINAFSFWGLFGQWKPDNIYFQYGSYILFLVSTILFSKKVWNNKNFPYLLSAFVFTFTFFFFTRMHERHMLPLLAPLTIVAMEASVYFIPLIGLSMVYILNLYYSYQWINKENLVSFDPLPVILLGLVSFFVFVFVSLRLERAQKYFLRFIDTFKNSKSDSKVRVNFQKVNLTTKKTNFIIGGILIFSLVSRIYNLGIPRTDYFDEIYHAFTARVVLHNDPKAWEWWNPHPEGFAYEWTHPPLSKLMMVSGMKVFGENSFGWRIPQAAFGTLSVYLVFLLTKKVFKDDLIALFSACILALDGLGLVLSRMAMNDVYVLFFMLGSVYAFISKRNFLSAISLGLAISSKWSAVWTVPILFVLWLRKENKFQISLLWFLLVPAVYLLTYIPMFLTGHDLGTFWGMQKQMWWYHTGLEATHPYTSPWWTWPLNLRPVYLYTSDEINGFVSRIYAIGNPIVFWFGLASIFTSLIYAKVEKNKELGLVIFSYLIFFVPWAMSPRIMFLYHYLPSVPFLAIATGYVLRRNLKIAPFIIAFSLLSFIYFYPHWAGLSIPLWLDKSYYWIESWR